MPNCVEFCLESCRKVSKQVQGGGKLLANGLQDVVNLDSIWSGVSNEHILLRSILGAGHAQRLMMGVVIQVDL